MKARATTVKGYLASLPADRREALEAVRSVILENLDPAYEEGIQYGMIGYYVPHSVYPPGYHCDAKQPLPFASLASQKNHMAVYLMCIYGSEEQEGWFRREWAKSGKRLDMGKSCVRFRKLEDVALDVIGRAVKRVPAKKYVRYYEEVIATVAQRRPAKRKKSAGKKAAPGKAAKRATKRAAKRKGAPKKAAKKRTRK
jgi:hypothetical protein